MTVTPDTSSARRVGGRSALAAGLLVAGAGVAVWWALVLRWSPCWGDFNSAPCMARQDHLYDSFLPSDPWVAIPGVAQLEGLAYLLLAAGLGIGATAYVRRGWVRAGWVVLLAAVAGVGGLTVVSGIGAATLPVNHPVYAAWMLGAVLVLGMAVAVLVDGAQDRVAWAFAAVLAVLAFHNSIAEYVFSNAAYGSHDTAPWTGALSAGLYVGLGGWIAMVGALRMARGERSLQQGAVNLH